MPNQELVDYFIDQTNKRFDSVDQKLEQLGHDIKLNSSFRFMLIGGAGVVSTIISLLVAFYFHR